MEKKMHLALKFEILKKKGSQANFSMEVCEHESKVSAVIRGRRKLTPEQAAKWQKILGCEPKLLKPVTK
jgi:plasmid maintenance system antidote protein VapI